MLPLLIPAGDLPFHNGDYLFLPGIRSELESKKDAITAYTVDPAAGTLTAFELKLGALTDDEREIILDGCLINYYRNH